MSTLSIDLRERILAVYDTGEFTRQQVASRFCVSLGMVKKLLRQRKLTGDIAPLNHRSGRKPKILASHRRIFEKALEETPGLTLEELKERAGLDCCVQAIHYVPRDMGWSFKKKRCEPASKTGRMSGRQGRTGKRASPAQTPRSLFSLMNPGRKRTWPGFADGAGKACAAMRPRPPGAGAAPR